jgi:hypothetical protein
MLFDIDTNRIEPVSQKISEESIIEGSVHKSSQAMIPDSIKKEKTVTEKKIPERELTIKEINHMINYGKKGENND